jgi:hypothetical protein
MSKLTKHPITHQNDERLNQTNLSQKISKHSIIPIRGKITLTQLREMLGYGRSPHA